MHETSKVEKEKHVITKVSPESIGSEIGLEPGDKLVAINGEKITDILDYYYMMSEDEFEITVEKTSGEEWVVEIERDAGEKMGLEFKTPTISPIKKCHNNCVFCFINQLPKGLRTSLYLKDDDYRLSPFYGNYVTLTNLTDNELDRIIKYKVSPLYISVHTTNGQLRSRMLRNEKASTINELLQELAEAGIEIHGQIVLCPGLNDSRELDNTIVQLADLYPQFKSLAVVPVGLTSHRDQLQLVEPVSKEMAASVIEQVEKHQARLLTQLNTRFVYLADEFYLKGNKPFPEASAYEGFPQIDNGVGLVKKLQGEVKSALKYCDGWTEPVQGTIVTGVLGEKVMKDVLGDLSNHLGPIDIEILPIKNRLFGEMVTVTGLIGGQDIIKQLKGEDYKSPVMIPDVMLKDNGSLFLDDISFSDLQRYLSVDIIKVPVDGKALVQTLYKLSNKGADFIE